MRPIQFLNWKLSLLVTGERCHTIYQPLDKTPPQFQGILRIQHNYAKMNRSVYEKFTKILESLGHWKSWKVSYRDRIKGWSPPNGFYNPEGTRSWLILTFLSTYGGAHAGSLTTSKDNFVRQANASERTDIRPKVPPRHWRHPLYRIDIS